MSGMDAHSYRAERARRGSGSRTLSLPRRRWLLALALAPVLAVLGAVVAQSSGAAASPGADVPGGFVRAEGAQLIAGGELWQPVGFNDYRAVAAPGSYVCDGDVGALDDGSLGERLDRAEAAGANVIRTWFFQASWDDDGDGDGDFDALDRVVEQAAARGLRVVPVLANHWADCENGGPQKDLSFYAGGYREPHGAYALSYLEWAETVAGRYAGSTAIAYWQLINEPEAPDAAGACDEAAASAAMAGFAAEAASVIRRADPNHLISLGTIGGGQCGTAGSSYLAAHEAVDICEIHVYDGPETGTSPADPLPAAAGSAIAGCEAAGKPVVAGELGFAADLDEAGNPTGAVTEATLANRAAFLADRVTAMGEAGLDGFMVWNLDDRAPLTDGAETYSIGPCDPIEPVVRGLATGSAPAGGTDCS